MSSILGGVIDVALVERLLSQRPTAPSDGECAEVDDLALVLAGYAEKEQIQTASEHLVSCSACAEAVLELNSMIAQSVIEPLQRTAMGTSNVRPFSRAIKTRWRRAALAAAAVLVVGFAAVFYWQISEERPYDPGSRFAIKGAADNLFVAVQRGPSQFTAQPFDNLEEGDQLGLFYSAEASGYIAVFSLDGEHETSLLYPAGGAMSAAIAPGERVPLPDGAIVSRGAGCEWIVAVFSEQSLPVERLTAAISRAEQTSQECHLELEITDARTLQIFPVLR